MGARVRVWHCHLPFGGPFPSSRFNHARILSAPASIEAAECTDETPPMRLFGGRESSLQTSTNRFLISGLRNQHISPSRSSTPIVSSTCTSSSAPSSDANPTLKNKHTIHPGCPEPHGPSPLPNVQCAPQVPPPSAPPFSSGSPDRRTPPVLSLGSNRTA